MPTALEARRRFDDRCRSDDTSEGQPGMAELVWEGKYRDGKRVAPVRLALPFQTVEPVNESAQDRMRTEGGAAC